MKTTADPSHAGPSQEAYQQASRTLIWFGAVMIALTLAIGALFGHDQWVAAQIRQRGRTVPARILTVEDPFGGDSAAVQYTFTLPSGRRVVDTVHAPPKKVGEVLGTAPSPFGLSPGRGQRFPPATVRYMPADPSRHRLQGFESSTGSPLGAAVGLGLFLVLGGVFLGKGLQLRQEALAPAPGGGPTPPGLTETLAQSGSLPGLRGQPGFTYRQEGQCFVLTRARYSLSQVLMTVMTTSLAVGIFGLFAYGGATMVRGAWQGWHGIDVTGQTVNGLPMSQAGTPALIVGAAFGAVLFLFGFVRVALLAWNMGEDLCLGTRPSVLDRGRGEFRVGPRVVCGLADIARLHLRRGHDPDAPEDLAGARYYASLVLRDGRRVPLGLSARGSNFRKIQETPLGDGGAGAQIEAVMQAAAAFLGVEYALTRGPDHCLRRGAE